MELLILVLLIPLIIMWIVFPFAVHHNLYKLRQSAQRIELLLTNLVQWQEFEAQRREELRRSGQVE